MAYHVNGSGVQEFTTGVYVPEIPQIPQLGDNWGGSGGARGKDPRVNPDGTYNFEEKFRRASGRREWVMEEKRLRAADASSKYKDRIALAQIKREQILELEKQRREEAWERSQRNAERALEQKMVRNEMRSVAAGSLRKSGGMYRSNSTPNVSFTTRRSQKPSSAGPLTANMTPRNRPSSYCAQPSSSRMVGRRSTFDNATSGSRAGSYYKGASTGNIGPKAFQGISNNRASLRSPNPSAYAKSPRPLSSQDMSSNKSGQSDSSNPSNHHVPFMKKPLFDPAQVKRRSVMDIKSSRVDSPRSPIALTNNTKLENRPTVPRTPAARRASASNRKSESSHDLPCTGSRDSLSDSKNSSLQNQTTELSEEEAYRIKLMTKRKEAKEREQAEKERRLKEEAEEEERRLIRLEEERKLQEERRIEAERLAEEERKLEAERKLEEEKRLEEERKLEEQRKLEREQKLEEERKLEAERKLKEEIEAKEKKLIEQLTGGANANSQGTTADKSGENSPAVEPATFDEAQRLLQQKEEEERAARKAHMQNIMARVRAANSSGRNSPNPSVSILNVESNSNTTTKDSSQSETDQTSSPTENSSTQNSAASEVDEKDTTKSDLHEGNDDVFDAPKEHDVSKETVVVSERILSESEDEHV